MGPRVLLALLSLTAAAVAQPPKITSFVNSATLDTNFGPGSGLVIYGTFTPHSAGGITASPWAARLPEST